VSDSATALRFHRTIERRDDPELKSCGSVWHSNRSSLTSACQRTHVRLGRAREGEAGRPFFRLWESATQAGEKCGSEVASAVKFLLGGTSPKIGVHQFVPSPAHTTNANTSAGSKLATRLRRPFPHKLHCSSLSLTRENGSEFLFAALSNNRCIS
jgi:hypothetical protein